MEAENRRNVEAFLDLINNQHRVREAFERHAAADYIQHNPACANGLEDAIALIEGLIATPGFHATVKRMVAQGDLVAAHMHIDLGEGRPGMAVMDMWRLKDGKLAEHWDVIQEIPAQTVSGNAMV